MRIQTLFPYLAVLIACGCNSSKQGQSPHPVHALPSHGIYTPVPAKELPIKSSDLIGNWEVQQVTGQIDSAHLVNGRSGETLMISHLFFNENGSFTLKLPDGGFMFENNLWTYDSAAQTIIIRNVLKKEVMRLQVWRDPWPDQFWLLVKHVEIEFRIRRFAAL